MRTALLCAGVGLVGACAQASIGNAPPDTGNHGGRDVNNNGIDSSEPIDARPIDAFIPSPDASVAFTVTGTTANNIVYMDSLTCSYGGEYSADNQWYRAFELSDYAQIHGGFHITSVTFGVQESSDVSGTTVSIGSYSDPLGGATINPASVTMLATAPATVPNITGGVGLGMLINAPIVADIPMDGRFVVEVSVPDLDNVGYMFIAGTNSGEFHPGYWSSSACGETTETTVAGGDAGQLIINVNGTY